MTITAHLPAASAGQTVYFRLVTPDPDDLSPYERDAAGNADTLPGNNRHIPTELAFKAGKLNGGIVPVAVVATAATINGKSVAAAEVEFSFNDFAGNNYQVEASLDPTFAGSVERTAVLVAWKRIYLEIDRMYKFGATITADFAVDADADNDVLTVDNATDFVLDNPATTTVDESAVVLFKPDGSTLNRQVLAVAGNTITVADLEIAFPEYSGVKLQNNNDTYDASLDLLKTAYGDATDGSDGGAFVEFKFPVTGSGNIPKYTFFPAMRTFVFCSYWFSNRVDTMNLVQLVAAYEEGPDITGFIAGGRADADLNIAAIFTKTYATPANTAEAVVHELGHQLRCIYPANKHIDRRVDRLNHDTSDQCVMSYNNSQLNGKCEFDAAPIAADEKPCLYIIRDISDPI